MLEIPGLGSLKYLVLDLDGILAPDGEPYMGVVERLTALGSLLQIHLIGLQELDSPLVKKLDVKAVRFEGPASESENRAAYIRSLGGDQVVALGSSARDALMLHESRIGLAVMGRVGVATSVLSGADVLSADINQALDLLISPRNLVAILADCS